MLRDCDYIVIFQCTAFVVKDVAGRVIRNGVSVVHFYVTHSLS